MSVKFFKKLLKRFKLLKAFKSHSEFNTANYSCTNRFNTATVVFLGSIYKIILDDFFKFYNLVDSKILTGNYSIFLF